jgi:hypothetical protein
MTRAPGPISRRTLRGTCLRASPLLLPVVLIAGVAVAAASGPGAAVAARRPAAVYHPLLSVARTGTSFHTSTSSNWSGYNQGFLEKDTTFSSISAQWVVPTATQHTAGQAEDSATWIGIGGGCLDTSCTATDSTLVQAGTEQDVAADGTASYSAWWELVPVPSVTASITVHPGDVISCDISAIVPGVWSVVLDDLTDGQSFTETLPYPSTELTAEWVEETPVEIGTSGTGLAALPNLSTVTFSHATVNGANAGLTSAEGLQLVDSNGNPIATPSAPDGGGDSFNDCAWASTCAAP